MTPPNAAATVDPSASPIDDLQSTDVSEDLIAELDALDDPERASTDALDDALATPSDSPTPDAAADKTESPSPAAAVPTDSPPPDPFAELTKDAKPFTYTVDRQERPFEGIVITTNGAGYIAPEHIERIRNTFGLAEKSIADNKDLYHKVQGFERLGGPAKIEALEQQVAQLDAAGSQLLALLKDPTAILMLNEEGQVVRNEKAIADLTERLQFVSEKAAFEARTKFQQMTQQVEQTVGQGQQQQQALEAVYGQFAQQYPDLTPQDLAAAKQHFGNFAGALFRPATPEDAQRYGYRIGELLIDTPKMTPWFEDRAALRASAKAQDTARRKAEDENRKRQPATPVASPRSAKAADQPRRKDGTFAEKQADKERIKREMKAAHRRGEFYVERSTESDV